MPGYLVNPGDHIDAPLSNYVAAYLPVGSIADDVCPIVPVSRRTDKFYTWDKASLLRFETDQRRARLTKPRFIEPTESVSGYMAVEYELSAAIEDGDVPNTDTMLALEQVKSMFVANQIRLGRESRVAALLRKTTNGGQLTLGTNLSGTARWDSSAPLPITDFTTANEAIRTITGYKPTHAVIPAAAAKSLVNITAVQTLIQYIAGIQYARDLSLPLGGTSNAGSAEGSPLQRGNTYQYLPAVFLGLQILEPGLVVNTAAENAAFSGSDLWGKAVRFLYVNPTTPNMEIPSCAYTFRSTEYGTAGWNVRRWREEGARATFYGVGVIDDERVVAVDLGYELDTVVS